jgi:hypothetical protein
MLAYNTDTLGRPGRANTSHRSLRQSTPITSERPRNTVCAAVPCPHEFFPWQVVSDRVSPSLRCRTGVRS